MKQQIYKTNHFREQAWERGIYQHEVDKITEQIDKEELKGKSRIVVGKEKLKELWMKSKDDCLILIAKGHLLITTFFVDNLYNYLKSKKEKINTIIL
ncbi:MAG: hypothetical protein K8R54_04160 [Bacteroidales bacterium]|nr:hypothetical protein [Bacteroidales bacterium]